MIKQIINGKPVRTINAEMSSADAVALSAVLAGKQEVWSESASGGTPISVPVLNFLKFSVGKKSGIRRGNSCAVFVPHLKPSKSDADVRTAVVGVWDQDYNTSTKCDYARTILAKN